MNPVNLIASRYLTSRKGVSLVSTLTMISIGGITIGTALLIIVLSVFNGFFDVVKSLLLKYDPDIRIESANDRIFIRDQEIEQRILQIPGVVAVAPYIEGKSLIAHHGGQDKVVIVRGIESGSFFKVVDLDFQGNGDQPILGVENRLPGMLIGQDLQATLAIGTGDRVTLLSAEGIRRSLTRFSGPRFYTFEVRGSFYLQQVYEGSIVFVDLQAAQRLFTQPNGISGFDIKLVNHEHAANISAQIKEVLGDGYTVKTWYDLQKPLYDVMNLEKWSSYFILMLIVLVAVLNIVGSLTMIVIQKTRDIGILMSMGFTKAHIKSIFLRQGVLIGLIGCFLGGGVGLVLSWLQQQYGIVKLAGAESFIISAYPVSISWVDVVLVIAGSLTLCILASYYPAKRASTLQPSHVLRYD